MWSKMTKSGKMNRKTDIFVGKKTEYHYHGYVPGKDTEPKDEPVTEVDFEVLEKRSDTIPDFQDKTGLSEGLETLKKNKFIVVSCLDNQIGQSAVYGLIESFNNYDTLRLQSQFLKKCDYTVETLTSSISTKVKDTIILIEIRSKIFLDSLFNVGTYISSIIHTLKSKNVHVICLLSSMVDAEDTVIQTWDEKRFGLKHFGKWHIDFLEPLLQLELVEDSSDYIIKIKAQRTNGLWGDVESDFIFYERIFSTINRKGAEGFKIHLDKLEDSNKHIDKDDIEDTFDEQIEDNRLHKAIIFIVTFFQRVKHDELDDLLNIILQNEKEKSEYVKIKNDEGETKNVKKVIEKIPLEEWQLLSTRKLFKELNIVSQTDIKGESYLDFNRDHYRKTYRQLLEEDVLYLKKSYELILESHLFVSEASSPQLMLNLIDFAVRMGKMNQRIYGTNALFSIFFKIQNANIKISLTSNIDSFEKLAGNINAKNEKRYLLRRLAHIIAAFTVTPSLEKIAAGFLNQLISISHGSLINLLNILRFVEDFDELYWIKQIIERGTPDARKEAYGFLIEIAKNSPERIFELLSLIKEWCPDNDTPSENFSPSQTLGVAFIIDYIFVTANNYPTGIYGFHPTKYVLFDTSINDSEEYENSYFFIGWLFLQNMDYAYTRVQKLFDLKENILIDGVPYHINATVILADIIELWAKILLGKNIKKSNTENQPIFSNVTKEIFKHSTPEKRAEMVKWWNVKLWLLNQRILKLSKLLSKHKHDSGFIKNYIKEEEIIKTNVLSLKYLIKIFNKKNYK